VALLAASAAAPLRPAEHKGGREINVLGLLDQD
jgi:hypothetical protein